MKNQNIKREKKGALKSKGAVIINQVSLCRYEESYLVPRSELLKYKDKTLKTPESLLKNKMYRDGYKSGLETHDPFSENAHSSYKPLMRMAIFDSVRKARLAVKELNKNIFYDKDDLNTLFFWLGVRKGMIKSKSKNNISKLNGL